MGISRREFARRLGISERAVRKHIASGLLAPAVLPDNTIDPDLASELLGRGLTRGARSSAGLAASRHNKLKRVTALEFDRTQEARRNTLALPDARRGHVKFSRIVAARLRRIPDEAAPLVAGKPLVESQRLLRDAIYSALVDLSGDDATEPAPSTEPDIDQAGEAPAETAATRNELIAERLLLERALARGQAMTIAQAQAIFEEALVMCKSLVVAIPTDPALNFEELDASAARAALVPPVERAVAALHSELVSADDLAA